MTFATGILLLRDRLSTSDPGAMLGPLALAGAGAGAVPSITQVTAMSDVPRSEVGGGTSLLQAVQRVSQALGVAMLATIVALTGQASAGLADAYLTAAVVAGGCAVLAVVLPGWPGRR